jgi:hypothetical protein
MTTVATPLPIRLVSERHSLTEPFLKLWEREVFALLLAEGKITEEVVQNIQSWNQQEPGTTS